MYSDPNIFKMLVTEFKRFEQIEADENRILEQNSAQMNLVGTLFNNSRKRVVYSMNLEASEHIDDSMLLNR